MTSLSEPDAPPPLLTDLHRAEGDAPTAPVIRRRRWPRLLVVALLAVAGAGAGAWWYADSLVGEFSSGDKQQVVDEARRVLGTPPPQILASSPHERRDQTINVLLIGSDTRGSDRGRSDTMILARLDQRANTLSLLSIPRDLQVAVPGHGTTKINAAYSYGGASLLIETVRDTFGVPIHHFAVVDFRGFRKVVDSLGGVYLPIDQRYYNRNDGSAANNYADIDLHAGYQKLSGTNALQWVRFRHKDSDFFRAARQQLFLRELKRQLTARDNVPDLPSVLRSVAKATTSDLDSVSETLRLARAILDVPASRLFRVTLEADGGLYGGVYYMRASESQRREAVRQWLDPLKSFGRPPSSDRRSGGQPTPAPRPVRALTADAGAGRIVSAARATIALCTPTRRPASLRWASDEPVRRYQLAGHETVAFSQTFGMSGKGVVWMFSSWREVPVLAEPDEVRRVSGRDLELFWENGKLRMVGWRVGTTRAWLTNTLRNDLSSAEMLGMVAACRQQRPA